MNAETPTASSAAAAPKSDAAAPKSDAARKILIFCIAAVLAAIIGAYTGALNGGAVRFCVGSAAGSGVAYLFVRQSSAV